ncbi:hypothetical protein [Falsiroseomonas sp. CW058]|uniref:hypothetical protein n=1 Tax=Falsiroseomonas sp. CW058 TaxID=3388664 RepID=UPI003D3132CF
MTETAKVMAAGMAAVMAAVTVVAATAVATATSHRARGAAVTRPTLAGPAPQG